MKTSGVIYAMLFGALFAAAPNQAQAKNEKTISLTPIGRYSAGPSASQPVLLPRAEIAAYDPATNRLFAINADQSRIDVLDISAPHLPTPLAPIPLGSGLLPNSIAIHDGIVAVALQADPKTNPGVVKFFDTDGALLNQVTVGALPDMLVFSRNGRWLLVANEGEPSSYLVPGSLVNDPEGSVSIIDMRRGPAFLTQDDVKTATFDESIPKTNASSIRIYGPGATLAQDLEPEYISVSHDSKTAWVTLQENNAIAILDIEKGKFTRLIGLGFKDHSLFGNGLDASDQDLLVDNGPLLKDGINIKNWPVFGMYQPDGIASYRVNGETYLVTANEGDTRADWPGFNEEVRVGASDYVLDPLVFPNAATDLKPNANLGRLVVTNATGNTDGDPQFEKIFVPGARSFSIRRANGTLVYDSGDEFERRIAALVPDLFNSDGTAASFNGRSDNKGPEPEGVAIGKVSGRTYAFIGLERTGGIMVFDISDPRRPFFVEYANTSPTDISPEGVLFIQAKHSPNGKSLVVVSHEVSNTTTIFQIDAQRRGDDDDDDDDD